ncbi:hypothetical protein TIFTF001_002090 [Ficus carica]|uniref:Uncharacterized protein n=1 Tax=Ficus carica TaxID=3494 RepID=A0AA87ZKA4_FICCA|nr:hypothetical protein TIFTF001_002090 [Ficus carica]
MTITSLILSLFLPPSPSSLFLFSLPPIYPYRLCEVVVANLALSSSSSLGILSVAMRLRLQSNLEGEEIVTSPKLYKRRVVNSVIA